MYKDIFERIAGFFSSHPYLEEFKRARKNFFDLTGKVFEDEPIYEVRISCFLEWYLFDRCLEGAGIPPVRFFRLSFQDKLLEAEKKSLLNFEESFQSLFSLESKMEEKIRVKDLLYQREYEIPIKPHDLGIQLKDLFHARLVQAGDSQEKIFTDSLWVHPSDARALICAEIKRGFKFDTFSSSEFLLELTYMRLKRERYAHVPISQIYTWNKEKNEEIK